MVGFSRMVNQHRNLLAAALIVAAVSTALVSARPASASKSNSIVSDRPVSSVTPSDVVTRVAVPNQQKHVLFIGIDGFRNADLQDPLLINKTDTPNIVALQQAGVTYTNNYIPVPSDSFPGVISIFTGASPKTTGVYYDDVYSRSLYPNGTIIVGNTPTLNGNPVAAGAECAYNEKNDTAFKFLNGISQQATPGTGAGYDLSSINPANLPVMVTNNGGTLTAAPVYPYSFLKCNTVYELAHAAGYRTAWCEKHPAYGILGGKTLAIDDLYCPEGDSLPTIASIKDSLNNVTMPGPQGIVTTDPASTITFTDDGLGLKQSKDLNTAFGEDDFRWAAVLNQINSKDSRGNAAKVPGLFGLDALAFNVAEKLKIGIPAGNTNINGGIDIVSGAEVVSANMKTAIKRMDYKIGLVVAALKANNLYNNTLIILSSKHGQTNRIGAATQCDSETIAETTLNTNSNAAYNGGNPIPVLFAKHDSACYIWLQNQAQTAAAVALLQNTVFVTGLPTNASNPATSPVKAVLSGASLAASGLGVSPGDDRAPDIAVQMNDGFIYDKTPATSLKRAEHGGFSDTETHVALMLSGGIPSSAQNSTYTGVTSSKQLAVTICEYLGLDASQLQGAAAEGTTALPVLNNKPNMARHVCIIDIDGFRQADFSDPLFAPYIPNILSLAKNGVSYTNAYTSTPADSYPGLMGMFTGASPKTSGVYYDDTYSRTLYPPGTILTGGVPNNPPGTEVMNFETIDFDFSKLGGGNGTFNASAINPANLSMSFANGVLAPVYPHNYLKVNTMFEVAHAAGFRTMWTDKHPAYEIVNGPSGLGLDDFYGPEVEADVTVSNGVLSDATVGAVSIKRDINAGVAYDNLKLKACLNVIAGKTSQGAAVPNNVVPGIFGMHYIGVSSFEKTVTGGIDVVNGVETINPDLITIIQNADNGVGQIVAALKAANLYDSTMIVLSAKHGQDPRIGKSIAAGDMSTIIQANGGPTVAWETADNASLLWLANQGQLAAAVAALQAAKGPANPQILTIYANTPGADAQLSSLPGIGDPLKEDRTPDIIVKLTPGYLIGSTSKKRVEHGGFSDNDTHVALIVSGGIPTNVRGTVQTAPVSNHSVAPLTLTYLGLDPLALSGVVAEATPQLPGVLDGPPYFTSFAIANPAYQVLAATPVATNFTAQAVSPIGSALTYNWNFGDPTSASNTFSGPGVLPSPNPNNVKIGTSVQHTYTAAGAYTATVTVTDGVNPELVSTVKVTVVGTANPGSLTNINNVIVIYQENWSFDGLYSKFPGANGLVGAQAKLAANPQIDVFNGNAVLATLPAPLNGTVDPNFVNFSETPTLYDATKYISATTLTGDIIHRFYTEQSQIDSGKMDKFVTLADNPGLVMSTFDATPMPEGLLAQQYVMCDNFFHASFGGSFLNHQWLIAAQTPTFAQAPTSVNNFVQGPNGSTQTNGTAGAAVFTGVLNGNNGFDTNGNPNPLKKTVGTSYQSSNIDDTVTSDGYVVNTAFTVNTPHPATQNPATLIPNQTNATIGDRLNDAGLSWKWYSGGWDNALAGNPDPLFQFHHQPFAFYANYADGTQAKKDHLQDETKFFTDLTNGTLPNVCFIKPLGPDNEHPGYAALARGQAHVASIVAAVQASPYWQHCAIVITYDEHGGRYDHVAPPSAATNAPANTYDRFGPGIRVPGIIISPYAKKGFVDHTVYDTTSILKFIEKRWNLPALSTRDAAVNSLDNAFNFNQPPVAAPTAVPSTAGVGQTVNFAANASSPTSSALTVTWNFGDGSATVTGVAVSHAYNAAGAYTATVTVADTLNPPVVQTVPVTVKNPTIGTGKDSDGDGFSDAVELANGSNPFDATSTPFGTNPAPAPVTITTLTKTKVTLVFDPNKPGSDKYSFSGTLPVPAGFNFTGKQVMIDFGGAVQTVTLNSKGASSKGNETFSFGKVKKGTTNAPFKAMFKNEDVKAALAASGLTNATVSGKAVTITVNIAFNGAIYTQAVKLTYTATKDVSGSAQ